MKNNVNGENAHTKTKRTTRLILVLLFVSLPELVTSMSHKMKIKKYFHPYSIYRPLLRKFIKDFLFFTEVESNFRN